MKATHPSEGKLIQKFRKLPEDRKSEVLDFLDFLTRRKSPKLTEGEAYKASLEALRLRIRERGGIIAGKGKEQVIRELRTTRDSLWKDDYADRFGQ